MTQQNRSLFRFEEITELQNVTDITYLSVQRKHISSVFMLNSKSC